MPSFVANVPMPVATLAVSGAVSVAIGVAVAAAASDDENTVALTLVDTHGNIINANGTVTHPVTHPAGPYGGDGSCTITDITCTDSEGGALWEADSLALAVNFNLSVTDYDTYDSGIVSIGMPGLFSSSFDVSGLTSTPEFSNEQDTITGTFGSLIEAMLSGADTVTGSAGKDNLHGYAGNDHMNGGGSHDKLFGDAGNDVMDGGTGNDTLSGLAGADQLKGSAGNDDLSGGAGNDKLTGGTGADFFQFNTALNATNNKDTIVDFNHLDHDKIVLDDDIFTKFAGRTIVPAAQLHVGAAAADSNDYLNYNPATGELTYDSNGSQSGGNPVVFAVLGTSTHPATLSAADFVVVG